MRAVSFFLVCFTILSCHSGEVPIIKTDELKKKVFNTSTVDGQRGIVMIRRTQNFISVEGKEFGVARELYGSSTGPAWSTEAEVNILYRKISDVGRPLHPIFSKDVVILAEEFSNEPWSDELSALREYLLFQVVEEDTDGDRVLSPRDRKALFVLYLRENRLQRIHPEEVDVTEVFPPGSYPGEKGSWIVFKGKEQGKDEDMLFVFHLERGKLERFAFNSKSPENR